MPSPTPPPARSPAIVALGPRTIWRVHRQEFRAAQFHPGGQSDARFSPLHDVHRRPIPTLYGASTLDGALMETIFHDIPTPPDGYILDLERLREARLVVSRLRPTRSLRLVDLSTKGLRRLGLARTDLIDTPVDAYALTRRWAEWLHAHTTARGLVWTSRQDDEAKALVLFGDRIVESALRIDVDREPLCDDPHLDAVLALAEHIGIEQIHGL
jgi:hypothetical protein